MNNNVEADRQRQLFVATSILESVGISIEELKYHLIELKAILGAKFEQLVPYRINDFSTLHWVVSLSTRLQKLRSCIGFDRHIARYTSRQIRSNYFVAGIASYLYDRVECVELEPTTHRRRMADILARYRDQEVYLECKGIETRKFDFAQEHDHMLSILRQYLVDAPHQISITYKRPFSDAEINRLGESLRELIESVKADGKLIDNPDVSVNVVKRDSLGFKGLRLRISMIEEDLSERCRYPGDAYGVDGISISIAGPKVDYKSVLRERIRRSKRQYLEGKPFVLVINANEMLGSLVENIRALSSAFQPNINTRFSSAVLVESNPVIGSPRTDFVFNFVSNPFAEYPVSKQFELLFKSSTE